MIFDLKIEVFYIENEIIDLGEYVDSSLDIKFKIDDLLLGSPNWFLNKFMDYVYNQIIPVYINKIPNNRLKKLLEDSPTLTYSYLGIKNIKNLLNIEYMKSVEFSIQNSIFEFHFNIKRKL